MSGTVRGSRMTQSSLESDRYGARVEHRTCSYCCADGHLTELNFVADVEAPQDWDCRHCGKLAELVGAPASDATVPLRAPSDRALALVHSGAGATSRAAAPAGAASIGAVAAAKLTGKTHLDQLLSRRTAQELEELIVERLKVRRRQAG